jgi:DNA-binding CsgD family transcriptional regulator/PAS domain-containing protein
MAAPSLREVSNVIGAIYDAGLDASADRWPAVLDRLSGLLGGGAPATLALERRSLAYARSVSSGIDARDVARYTSYYARLDPVVVPHLAHAEPGRLVVASARVTPSELRRGEFYTDFARPLDMFDCAAAVVLRDGSASASLFVTRAHRARPFGRAPLALLTLLLPHVARAAQTALTLARLAPGSSGSDDLRRAADALGADRRAAEGRAAGVLLTDAAGRVQYADPRAEALLAADDGLGVERRPADWRPARLRGATPEATAALRARIARAADAAWGDRGGVEREAGGSRLSLARPSGRTPLSVLVVPLPRASAARSPWQAMASGSAAAVVLVTEERRGPGGGAATIPRDAQPAAGVRLTARERQVAALLARRATNPEIAAALGVSPHTARHHTEHVLRKLGLSSRRMLSHDGPFDGRPNAPGAAPGALRAHVRPDATGGSP